MRNCALPLAVAGDKLGLVIVDVPLFVLLDVVLLDWICESAVDVVKTKELWWFSVCRLSDRASQYDLPQPSALHSYGFLFRCVNMWPFLIAKGIDVIKLKQLLFRNWKILQMILSLERLWTHPAYIFSLVAVSQFVLGEGRCIAKHFTTNLWSRSKNE